MVKYLCCEGVIIVSKNIFEDDKFKKFLDQHGEQIKGMAKNVTPDVLTDEKQLKQTLKMIADMANIPADEKKFDKIVNVLKQEKFDPKNPDSVNKMLKNIKPPKKKKS